MVLAPRVTQAGMAPADNDNNNFEMERAYLLNSVNVEQQLFAELIKPLADRFMAGFNATVRVGQHSLSYLASLRHAGMLADKHAWHAVVRRADGKIVSSVSLC